MERKRETEKERQKEILQIPKKDVIQRKMDH